MAERREATMVIAEDTPWPTAPHFCIVNAPDDFILARVRMLDIGRLQMVFASGMDLLQRGLTVEELGEYIVRSTDDDEGSIVRTIDPTAKATMDWWLTMSHRAGSTSNWYRTWRWAYQSGR